MIVRHTLVIGGTGMLHRAAWPRWRRGWMVNSSIGWYTKDLTGMVTLKVGNPAKSGLIESYSTLGYRSDE